MNDKPTSRLRFGIRALLILVAVVAGVFLYLRNGPLLVKTREVSWRSSINQHDGLLYPKAFVTLRCEWHPWTSWRNNGNVRVRLLQVRGTTKFSPAGQEFSKETRELTAIEGTDNSTMLFDVWLNLGPKSKLEWNKNWGNPEVVLDEFVGDDDVEIWTPEAFLEWIDAREKK